MAEKENDIVDATVQALEEHPNLAIGALISYAEASTHGVYLGGVQIENRQHGIALGMILDDDRASQLFNFLHDLTEGVVPTWEEHAFDQEILRHPEGVVARDEEA